MARMQPSLFTLAHHDGERRGRVTSRRELRPTVRQLLPLAPGRAHPALALNRRAALALERRYGVIAAARR